MNIYGMTDIGLVRKENQDAYAVRICEETGHQNIVVGTVEFEPGIAPVLAKVKAQKPKKVYLAPLLVVAGDHANNDMAGDEEGSWYYGMVNGGEFEVEGADEAVDTGAGLGADNVNCQIAGLGRIPAIQEIYVAHTADAMNQ